MKMKNNEVIKLISLKYYRLYRGSRKQLYDTAWNAEG